MRQQRRLWPGRVAGLVLVSLSLAVFGGASTSAPATDLGGSEPFFFLQLADTQMGIKSKDQDFENEKINLDRAVDHINRLQPAFVVITGDLVNKPGDAAQIAALKAGLAKIKPQIPVYFVAGNHDVGNQPTPESLAAYRKTFGLDYFAFSLHGCRFIIFNSELAAHPALAKEAGEQQKKWLKAELQSDAVRTARQTVVFGHRPLYVREPAEKEDYHNFPPEPRAECLDLFHSARIAAYVTGHLHRNLLRREKNMEMITSDALSVSIGQGAVGMRIFKVFPDHIEHNYYDLNKVPQQISLEPAAGSQPAK